MFHKKNTQMGFADGYVERRTRKNTFFKQVNMLIDWSEIEKEISKVIPTRAIRSPLMQACCKGLLKTVKLKIAFNTKPIKTGH